MYSSTTVQYSTVLGERPNIYSRSQFVSLSASGAGRYRRKPNGRTLPRLDSTRRPSLRKANKRAKRLTSHVSIVSSLTSTSASTLSPATSNSLHIPPDTCLYIQNIHSPAHSKASSKPLKSDQKTENETPFRTIPSCNLCDLYFVLFLCSCFGTRGRN